MLAVIAVVAFGSGHLFRDTARFMSLFDGSISGLDIGAPVRFRGIQVGSVQDILLDLPGVQRERRDLRIAVVYDLDRGALESRGAMSRLSDPFNIDTLMALGVRAELATESLVTGRKYIALDLDPNRPVAMEPLEGAPYPEIPTVTTGLEGIEEAAYSLIAQLNAIRFDTLVMVATDALSRVGDLAGSPALTAAVDRLPATLDRLDAAAGDLQGLAVRLDSTLTPMSEGVRQTTDQATATLEQLDATLQNLDGVLQDAGGVLEPGSPVFVQFEQAMTELSGASRALRDLADYLERNPSALIRGRPGGNE